MLTAPQQDEIRAIVEAGLDRAEGMANQHYVVFDEATFRADVQKSVSSRIPGHDLVTSDGQSDELICLVADMRKSSEHLMCAIDGNRPSQLKRVHYETSALLPALERTIEFKGGSVTEYLGDGILALFRVGEDEGQCIKDAYRAAKNCIGETREIVNAALAHRYNLPPLDVGVGLGMSKAVVTLVGLEGQEHPKAIGQNVYYATKLARGKNQIIVDETLNLRWPVKEGKGGLKFRKKDFNGVEGYLIVPGDD